MKKTILVTGGNGFIGTNFIKMINDVWPSATIINIDDLTYAANLDNHLDIMHSEKYTFIKDNICNKKLMYHIFAKYDIDHVVHFAAESHVDNSIKKPNKCIQTNIIGTTILLNAAVQTWIKDRDHKFIYISTDEVFGNVNNSSFDENTKFNPSSPYSASKASAEHLVNAYHKTYGLKTIITNCTNNFGPYQHPEKLIPKVIDSCINNTIIPIYGEGINIRDWIYVKDHCSAIVKIIEEVNDFGQSFCIGSNNQYSNIDLVHEICQLFDNHPKFSVYANSLPKIGLIKHVKDRPGHDYHYATSINKILNNTSWRPIGNFKDQLIETIEWYINNQNWLNQMKVRVDK